MYWSDALSALPYTIISFGSTEEPLPTRRNIVYIYEKCVDQIKADGFDVPNALECVGGFRLMGEPMCHMGACGGGAHVWRISWK